MLQLLDTPRWVAVDGPAVALPATVPGGLLIYLAACGDGRGPWVDRESLVTLFWPERPAAEGQRNLRVNLHRLRSLLSAWGQADALHSERTRLRLALPTDLALCRAAIASGDAASLVAASPACWLQGFRIRGFEAFAHWADAERERCLRSWFLACEQAVEHGLLRDETAQVMALFAAWEAGGGAGMPALAALDPSGLSAAARATWQHLRARLPSAPPAAAGGPAPSASTMPVRARTLHGRRAEQDALRASSAAATLVLGEPGAGKSTLLTSCWPSAPMLQGREGLAGVPFAPVLEWLTLHSRQLTDLLCDPAAKLAAYRLDLARLLPELAPDEPLPPLDAHTAKARLLEALARVFETQGPVLLVDDLQWCDAATLEWLVFVGHRGRQRWCAAARRHELAGPARLMIDSLRAARLLEQQSLEALSRDALAEVCRQRWPQRTWDDTVLDALHHACAGNPFALVELIAIGADRSLARGEPVTPPRRMRDLVDQRLRPLSPVVRAVVEAAAVLARPAPLALLLAVFGGQRTGDGESEGLDESSVWGACQEALSTDLLRESDAGLECRHDLIRSAAEAGLGPTRRQWLHRRAALALGALRDAEPLVVAMHWQAAQEPQTALTWLHRGALQQRERGRFDEARVLWQRVADQSSDPTQALRARLALAETDLYHDLAQGRSALQQVLDQLGAVADVLQRDQIEGQALAGLVDNAVFAGDLPHAITLAPRLRRLLPRLHIEERRHGCEVLIELAMREPDIDAAWGLLAQLRQLAPRHPSTLSFEAQIHWFAGDARAARNAFDALLAAHPDYCTALTIENDLAVMLNALGDLVRAEEMARRSLLTWQGVAHTETLSLLVLGSVLTSSGRHGEALASLDQALRLGREQSSAMFEAEALVRRARLWLQCGQPQRAAADLDAAEPLLHGSTDPLRVSQYAVVRAVCQSAAGQDPQRALADRLRTISLRSAHPLLHARLARIDVALALSDGDAERATLAAQRQADIARAAGLLEPLTEALLLQARAGMLAHPGRDPRLLLAEAAVLADSHGFADLAWRAHAGLAALTGTAAHAAAAREACHRLDGGMPPVLFDTQQASRLEPWLPDAR